ncbi:hypothetical protein ABEH32_07405 [Pantoea agglomerans]|uniref:hypothetical protein n=1 Tax=Enterobacter agglomerans TaxID=549 RepID=UPI0016543D13|nr:hypothetical protein [Pantoea agglomerans]
MSEDYIIIEEQLTLPVKIGETDTAHITIPIYIVFDSEKNVVIGVFYSKEEALNRIEELRKKLKTGLRR